MNDNHQRLEPPSLAKYDLNRARFPLEDLARYAGKFVAFSPDGARILEFGDTEEELEQKLEAAGIPPSQVVGSYIDPLD